MAVNAREKRECIQEDLQADKYSFNKRIVLAGERQPPGLNGSYCVKGSENAGY